MNPDQLLTGALRDVAEDYIPVNPDLPAITAGGRRRRRARDVRRSVVVAAVVVATVAVPLVTDPFGSRATGPVDTPRVEEVTDLPVGDLPDIPYCPGDGTLRGAGQPVDAECDVMIHRGDSTLFLDRQGVNVLADGRLTLLDSRDWSTWFPALSQDGRWAAWVTETPEGPHEALLLAFDVRSGEQVAEVPWPTGDGWVAGIDDFGRVYFQDFATHDVRAYDIRTGESLPVSGVPDHGTNNVSFVTADGFGILDNHLDVVVGTVTADGRFTQQHPVDRGRGTSSPDRSLVAHEVDGRLVVSRDSGEGDDVALRLPAHGEPVWFPVWESSESVLVQFDPEAADLQLATSTGYDAPAGRTWLLRCFVDDGSCEVALPAGWGDGARWPIYR